MFVESILKTSLFREVFCYPNPIASAFYYGALHLSFLRLMLAALQVLRRSAPSPTEHKAQSVAIFTAKYDRDNTHKVQRTVMLTGNR